MTFFLRIISIPLFFILFSCDENNDSEDTSGMLELISENVCDDTDANETINFVESVEISNRNITRGEEFSLTIDFFSSGCDVFCGVRQRTEENNIFIELITKNLPNNGEVECLTSFFPDQTEQNIVIDEPIGDYNLMFIIEDGIFISEQITIE